MSASLGETEDGIGAVDDLLLTPFFQGAGEASLQYGEE